MPIDTYSNFWCCSWLWYCINMTMALWLFIEQSVGVLANQCFWSNSNKTLQQLICCLNLSNTHHSPEQLDIGWFWTVKELLLLETCSLKSMMKWTLFINQLYLIIWWHWLIILGDCDWNFWVEFVLCTSFIKMSGAVSFDQILVFTLKTWWYSLACPVCMHFNSMTYFKYWKSTYHWTLPTLNCFLVSLSHFWMQKPIYF